MFFEIQTCNGLFRSQGSFLRIADQKLYLLSQLLFCLIVNIIEINAVYRGAFGQRSLQHILNQLSRKNLVS